MEDILDLYAEAYDPKRPLVCFDELPYQLLTEVNPLLPAEPGKPKLKTTNMNAEVTARCLSVLNLP